MKSFSSRSAWLPTETQCENPMPMPYERSNSVPMSAPLWLMKPMGASIRWSTLSAGDEHSTSLLTGLIRPKQFGPINRMPCAAATATTSRSSASPSGPASENLDVMMMPALAPRSAQAAISPFTLSRGKAMMTMSGAVGVALTLGKVLMPNSESRPGLIGYTAPA
ncbi:hypothetical protein D9M72_443620 [compost metagenome]